jgi:hypothetical protein
LRGNNESENSRQRKRAAKNQLRRLTTENLCPLRARCQENS